MKTMNKYRGLPFWCWNGKLDKDEVIRQVHILKEMGFGGFFMHSRTGPAVLVVQPRGHAQFFRFFRGGADKIEPIFAEILGRKPRTAVHEKAAESHFL